MLLELQAWSNLSFGSFCVNLTNGQNCLSAESLILMKRAKKLRSDGNLGSRPANVHH